MVCTDLKNVYKYVMTSMRYSLPKSINVEVKVLQSDQKTKKLLFHTFEISNFFVMTPAPCEVQMALVATNVKHSVYPRWQFPRW